MRIILLFLVILSTVCSPLLAQAEEQQANKRPNILFAFADDWGRYASIYGKLEPGGPNDLVHTPNFDRIADEGTLFLNAFVNAPSCTPCRSSLLSGQYFWRTGRAAILQGAVWDDSTPTYPLILQKNGYHIGHTYKVWSPGRPRNAPYGGKQTAYNQAGRKMNRFSQVVSRADDKQAAKQKLLDEVRGNFELFLQDREKDQPFCYWFGPTNCHRKWIKGSGKDLWDIDPDDLKDKMPPFLPDVHAIRQDFADYLGEVQAFDASLGTLIKKLEDMGELDNTLIVVSGDHGIPGFPQGKCNLYDFGVAVPLAVRWGNGIENPGRVIEEFVNLPDLAPTFLEAAGQTPPDVMTGRSLLPLLTSSKQGQIDPQRDSVVVGRERHVAKARRDNLPYPQRAIRTDDFLYIRNFKPNRYPMGTGPGYGEPAAPMPPFEKLEKNTFAAFGDMDASPTKAWILTRHDQPDMQRFVDIAFGKRPAEELYDLNKDPHQVHNVADDPDYAQARKQLSKRLMKVLEETGDPRVTEEVPRYEKPPFTNP